MALTPQELQLFRERVLSAKNPLFFYDDDSDGLSSYLLCYRARGESGFGTRVHGSSIVTADYVRKVDENTPDLVVVLDKPQIEEAFLEQIGVPVLHLDHHEPQKIKANHLTYLNPRLHDDSDNRCATYWVWKALGRPQDLWIAAVGTISDWQMTDVAEEFRTLYPSLLGDARTAPQALYDEPFGKLAMLMQFNLKGDARDVRTAVKIFSRVETVDELLSKSTPRARLLAKRYEKVNREYQRLLKDARISAGEGKLLYHVFHHLEISLVSELSNQLVHEYPDKIIFLVRAHNGEHKLSIRSATVPVAAAVKKSMERSGARGNAGGHTHACGGKIVDEDFPKFFAAFRQELDI